jgi:hypothetical protein
MKPKEENLRPPAFSQKFTPERIVSWLARCLPNAEQVNWLDLGSMDMRFEWRGHKFQVRVETMAVNEINGALTIGSNEAALIEALLKKQWLMEAQK